MSSGHKTKVNKINCILNTNNDELELKISFVKEGTFNETNMCRNYIPKISKPL